MSSIITFTYCSKWNHLIYKALSSFLVDDELSWGNVPQCLDWLVNVLHLFLKETCVWARSLHALSMPDCVDIDARLVVRMRCTFLGDASCAYSPCSMSGRMICLAVANLPVLRRKRSVKLFVLDDMFWCDPMLHCVLPMCRLPRLIFVGVSSCR